MWPRWCVVWQARSNAVWRAVAGVPQKAVLNAEAACAVAGGRQDPGQAHLQGGASNILSSISRSTLQLRVHQQYSLCPVPCAVKRFKGEEGGSLSPYLAAVAVAVLQARLHVIRDVLVVKASASQAKARQARHDSRGPQGRGPSRAMLLCTMLLCTRRDRKPTPGWAYAATGGLPSDKQRISTGRDGTAGRRAHCTLAGARRSRRSCRRASQRS